MSGIKELLLNKAVKIAEQVLLPAEHLLCQQIIRKPKVRQILEQPDARVLLIGTDRKASLAQEFSVVHPETNITVIDRDPIVVAVARQNSQQTSAHFIDRDIFAIQPSDIPPPDFAVAKHFLHLVNSPAQLVSHVKILLKPEGVFYASVPPLTAWGPRHQLRAEGIKFTEEPLIGRGLKGGTLFTFRS